MTALALIAQQLQDQIKEGEHEGLIALDNRKVTKTQTSALISIPKAQQFGMVDEDSHHEATVSVRQLENEIVVTARISLD